MSDGKKGPTLELRGLFEQYYGETAVDVETVVERALRTPRLRR
jgi:hypothetical protein